MPGPTQGPFVVLDGEPPEELTFAANKAAQTLGVELGMSRLQAESFGVAILCRQVAWEDAAQTKLHEIACGFSPRIERVAQHSGTYALDIRGMYTIFGDAKQFATKLRQSIMGVGFLAHVAVSANFHAALCVARGRPGVSVVPQGCEADALAGLPLSVLELEPDHAERFATWGIRTCGELAALTETDLIARLGQAGKRLHALARGDRLHLMAPIEASFDASLVERMELDLPVEDLERLLFLLSCMTATLVARVCANARAITSIRLMLDLEGGMQYERTVRPALPLQDMRTLLKLIQLDLETYPPSTAILAMELQAQSTAPYRAQHGLFLPQAPEPGQTEVLLARLRKLLGEDRVGSPELTDDHRPNAFRMTPFTPPAPRSTESCSLSVPIALRISRPPQPIGVQLVNKCPTRVY
jgi:protein ImuB